MKEQSIMVHGLRLLLIGETSPKVYLFVHGKMGCKEEAKEFAKMACPKGWQVLALDLPEHGERSGSPEPFAPWQAVPELQAVLEYARARWTDIGLRANSIGAWFSMLAFGGQRLHRCLFVSPILDMERLITDMMQWAGVTEDMLMQKQTIPTDFGETLSWPYLCYVREHPITVWDGPTTILYAGKDNLTQRSTVDDFCARFHASLTVMENGEHWFHTPEQLKVLGEWTEENML